MRPLWPVLLALLVGCKPASRPNHPASEPGDDEVEGASLDMTNDGKPAVGSRRRGGGKPASGAVASSGSFERPVMRCGPKDSYAYVAREFQCPGGGNPFDGRLEGAQRARTGSKAHPGGHIVDLYDVPCSGGPVTVYVDMYGCPEAEALLQSRPTPALAGATQAFDRGDYRGAVKACLGIMDGDKVDADTVECLSMTPAAMMLDGADEGGLKLIGAFCGKAAALPTGVQVRKEHVTQVARWLARGGKGKMSREQYRALVSQVATACGVNDGQGA